MRIRARLERLERLAPAGPSPERPAQVELWLPDNARGGTAVGRHRCAASATVLVIYDPDFPEPEGRLS